MREEEKRIVEDPEEKRLRVALDIMARTDAGKIVLGYLAKRMGFFKSNLRRKLDGDIATLPTECLEAQRALYIELREKITPEVRHAYENLADAPPAPVVKLQEEERKK